MTKASFFYFSSIACVVLTFLSVFVAIKSEIFSVGWWWAVGVGAFFLISLIFILKKKSN